MLRWLLQRLVEAFERKWHYDASYLKEIIDISPRAAWMFARATSLGNYRRDVPVAALSAAGITAVRGEDCGPCTQLATAIRGTPGRIPGRASCGPDRRCDDDAGGCGAGVAVHARDAGA